MRALKEPLPLPLGSYQTQDTQASCKKLVGLFSEQTDTDAPDDVKSKVVPAHLRRMAGVRALQGFDDGSGLPVRGMWEMNGIEYVVIGHNFYSVSLSQVTQVATLTLLNPVTPIAGYGFVRMTDNGACLVILQPGTTNAWTYCPAAGTPFAALTASFFTTLGAIDCWFVDTFIVFLALNGNTFFNDDGRQVSGTGQITFATAASFGREFATDLFVGMAVDHRQIFLLGTRTSEGYVNVGAPTGSPFNSAPDTFMQKGCHPLCGYSVALQDESVLWVANDKTVRRRNGQTPTKISNPGIDQILGTSNLSGCYALTPTVYGHPLWVLVMPAAQRTIVYDCLTTKWFELESYGLGYWRPLCYHNAFGLQLVGDSQSSAVGVLDEATYGEWGTQQVCEWTTQAVYDANKLIIHRRVEVIATAGETTNMTTAPTIDILYSDDGGMTFQAVTDQVNLGGDGEFDARSFTYNIGVARKRVYKFRVTDPTPMFTVDMQADTERCKF